MSDKPGFYVASASMDSLPGRSWFSSPLTKKRKRSPSFAQASFRAQPMENQPLPSSLTAVNTNDLREGLFIDTLYALVHREQWPDDQATEAHARRLTEAMIRLGVDNLDNLITETSRINCGNMTITATLLSAVVVSLLSTTYTNNSTWGMRAANASFATSLFLSLATGVASFLAMEWLAWTSALDLRSESLIYCMMRTAMRSALMHSAIFLFFAGLLVLLWEVTPPSVYIMPTIVCIAFGLWYIAATFRPIYLTCWKGVGQFGAVDDRGLRVQVWTPFSVGVQRLTNYMWAAILSFGQWIETLIRPCNHQETPQTTDIEAQVETPSSETNGTRSTV